MFELLPPSHLPASKNESSQTSFPFFWFSAPEFCQEAPSRDTVTCPLPQWGRETTSGATC